MSTFLVILALVGFALLCVLLASGRIRLPGRGDSDGVAGPGDGPRSNRK